MTDIEISKMLDIPSNTLADWSKKKSKRNPLYSFLSKMSLSQAKEIDSRKQQLTDEPKFSSNAKSVKLDKSWFATDLLWSSAHDQRIGINRIITIYMSNPDQRNTDSLINLFGAERIEEVVNDNFDFDNRTKSVKSIALDQVHYGYAPIKRELNNSKNLLIDTDKLSKQLKYASQKEIDKIIAKVDERIVLEAAHKVRFPESYAIEEKIEYALGKVV